MRYVIAICLVTVLILWDMGANDSRYMRYTVMELKRITSMIGL